MVSYNVSVFHNVRGTEEFAQEEKKEERRKPWRDDKEESHYKERTRIEPLSQKVQSILKQN